MKRIVPFQVRCVSLLISAGITTLIVVVHGADLKTLGAPAAADRPTSATAPASESSGPVALADSPR